MIDALREISPFAKEISLVGLALDFIGIGLLFLFQVDRNHHLKPDGSIGLILEQADENEASKWRAYRILTVVGFMFLIVGFGFQFIGTLLS